MSTAQGTLIQMIFQRVLMLIFHKAEPRLSVMRQIFPYATESFVDREFLAIGKVCNYLILCIGCKASFVH